MRPTTHIVLALLCLSLAAQAQIATNRSIRPITLEEAIRLALENNLDIARVRYEPQIAAYRLSGDYAYYEPVFQASAVHRFSQTEGQTIDPATGLPTIGQKVDQDSFGGSPALTGILPITGLRYSIDSTFDHRAGTSGGRIVDDYSADVGIRLTQPLLRDLWIDQQRLNIKVAKKDVKISEHDVLLQVMNTVNDVEAAFYDLLGALDTVKAREISVSLADRLVDENRQRVKVGTMAPLDEKQAESEAALRRADLIQARSDVRRFENILKLLISNNYEQWHGAAIVPQEKLLAVPQTYDLQESWINGLTYRPDYNQAKERLERQGIVVSYTFNQLFPTLNAIGSYGRSGIDSRNPLPPSDPRFPGFRDASFSGTLADIKDETNPHWSYGVVLSVPLTFRAERANHRAAKAQLEQSKIDLQIVHQKSMVGIDDAIQAARSAYERVQATRAAREFAQTALDAEQKKLDNGRSTSFVVLRLQRDLTDARAEEIKALSDYNKSLSTLYFREGTILKRNNVNVEIEK